jgi:citrate synthase
MARTAGTAPPSDGRPAPDQGDDDDFGLLGYDPAFMNTASCRSAVTFIDGDKGILRYRGYDIAELASKSNHLEVAYLLLNGELPDQQQLDDVDGTESPCTRWCTRT